MEFVHKYNLAVAYASISLQFPYAVLEGLNQNKKAYEWQKYTYWEFLCTKFWVEVGLNWLLNIFSSPQAQPTYMGNADILLSCKSKVIDSISHEGLPFYFEKNKK